MKFKYVSMLKKEIFGALGKRTPSEILVFGFAAVILTGAILLTLPVANVDNKSTDFLDCLFTATSSVCVTGLVVVDTGTYWTLFGQTVIIVLIQLGGLGFMTLMTMVFVLAGKTITIKNRILIQSSVNSDRLEGIVRFTKYIVASALIIELIGGILYMTVFIPEFGWIKGIYFGLWHAVSSYCNAGFDLMGNYQSFTMYVNNSVMSLTSCGLIIIGGLGFAVTSEVKNYKMVRRLSLHSKIVLLMTSILILGGALLIFLFEHNNPNTLGPLPWYGKILSSFYQAITPRTAGSNTISQTGLTQAGLFLTMILMFIGGSPGSTAGGVKTTSIAMLFINLFSSLTGKKDNTCFKRTISSDTVRMASSIFLVGIIVVISVIGILLLAEPNVPMTHLAFEVFSAYSTVGLSCDLTPNLSFVSKCALILTMFIGRVGPMTIAYVLTRKERTERQNRGHYTLPEGKVLLG